MRFLQLASDEMGGGGVEMQPARSSSAEGSLADEVEEAIAWIEERCHASREDVIKALTATGGAPAVLRLTNGACT